MLNLAARKNEAFHLLIYPGWFFFFFRQRKPEPCQERDFAFLPGTFTDHISITLGNFDIYIPVDDDRSEGCVGRGGTFPFGDNVIEVPPSEVKEYDFDCILFQTAKNYTKDQFDILSFEQRLLPRLFLEHDPPQQTPTNTRHVVNDAL